jgi:hypothetical protein
MNAQSLAILALALPNVRTVRVLYDTGQKTYTFLTDLDLKKDDFVVVDATNPGEHPRVVRVTSVDSTPQLDFHNPDRKYRWVLQKVDVTSSAERTKQIAQVADQLAAVDYLSQQQAVMDRYLGLLPANSPAAVMMQAARANLQLQLTQVGVVNPDGTIAY